MRLLLTRPLAGAGELTSLLQAAGHHLICDALLTIENLPMEPIDHAQVQAVAVTSSNALRGLHPDTRLAEIPVYAVGTATARQARAQGFGNVIECGPDAASLAKALTAELSRTAGVILYLRGEDIAFELEDHLLASGFDVKPRIVYRAVPAELLSAETVNALIDSTLDGVILLSPRTARIYLKLIRQSGFANQIRHLTHFCLSQRIAGTLLAAGLTNTSIPARPDIQELVALIGAKATHS